MQAENISSEGLHFGGGSPAHGAQSSHRRARPIDGSNRPSL